MYVYICIIRAPRAVSSEVRCLSISTSLNILLTTETLKNYNWNGPIIIFLYILALRSQSYISIKDSETYSEHDMNLYFYCHE